MHAGETQHLGVLPDADLLLASHAQVAVGQHVDHGDRDRAGEEVARCGLALAVERVGRAGLRVERIDLASEHTLDARQSDLDVALALGARVGLLRRVQSFVDGDRQQIADEARLAVLEQRPIADCLEDAAGGRHCRPRAVAPARALVCPSAITGWRGVAQPASRDGDDMAKN